MYKSIFCLVLLINSSSCFSQTVDTFIVDKWANYNRPRAAGDKYGINQENKQYVTLQGDTLVRRVTISAEFNQVRMEESLLHGKPNGLELESDIFLAILSPIVTRRIEMVFLYNQA